MHKCSQCKTAMESKGEISEDRDIIFYRCPKCKMLNSIPHIAITSSE